MEFRLWMSFAILFLQGCAESQYVKAGATPDDFKVDQMECQNQILLSPIESPIGSGPMGKPGVREGITAQSTGQTELDNCLRAKGWGLETEKK